MGTDPPYISTRKQTPSQISCCHYMHFGARFFLPTLHFDEPQFFLFRERIKVGCGSSSQFYKETKAHINTYSDGSFFNKSIISPNHLDVFCVKELQVGHKSSLYFNKETPTQINCCHYMHFGESFFHQHIILTNHNFFSGRESKLAMGLLHNSIRKQKLILTVAKHIF